MAFFFNPTICIFIAFVVAVVINNIVNATDPDESIDEDKRCKKQISELFNKYEDGKSCVLHALSSLSMTTKNLYKYKYAHMYYDYLYRSIIKNLENVQSPSEFCNRHDHKDILEAEFGNKCINNAKYQVSKYPHRVEDVISVVYFQKRIEDYDKSDVKLLYMKHIIRHYEDLDLENEIPSPAKYCFNVDDELKED